MADKEYCKKHKLRCKSSICICTEVCAQNSDNDYSDDDRYPSGQTFVGKCCVGIGADPVSAFNYNDGGEKDHSVLSVHTFLTIKKALTLPDANNWRTAIDAEYTKLVSSDT